MDAKQYLTLLIRSTEEFPGLKETDWQPAYYTPRRVGAFGTDRTDRWTQAVMLDGERFTLTVEKDPYQ